MLASMESFAARANYFALLFSRKLFREGIPLSFAVVFGAMTLRSVTLLSGFKWLHRLDNMVFIGHG